MSSRHSVSDGMYAQCTSSYVIYKRWLEAHGVAHLQVLVSVFWLIQMPTWACVFNNRSQKSDWLLFLTVSKTTVSFQLLMWWRWRDRSTSNLSWPLHQESCIPHSLDLCWWNCNWCDWFLTQCSQRHFYCFVTVNVPTVEWWPFNQFVLTSWLLSQIMCYQYTCAWVAAVLNHQ